MDLNGQQFRQNSFDGFGDRPMRAYRVSRPATPRNTSPAQPDSPSGWTQPALPDPPAAPSQPAGPARLTPAAQARADIAEARAQARTARVATARANATAATHRQSLAEARAAQVQQRLAQATAPPRATPSGPVPDLTPPPPPATPSGPGRQVRINQLNFRSQGQRFGPPPEPDDPPAPSAVPPRPTTPPRPTAPPSTAAAGRGSRITPGMARAGRYAGVGTFVAAKALQSMQRPATDPKRSGNPLYKTNQGWMKS